MTKFKHRIKSLEQKATNAGPEIDSIIINFVSPGPSGPVDSGHAIATILVGPHKGLRLDREHGEAEQAFKDRVQAMVGSP